MTPEHPRESNPPPGRGERWQGEGFGVVFRGPYSVIGLARREGRAPGGATRLLLDNARTPAALPEGTRLRELRYPDGRLGLAIDDHGERGLRILAEGFGAHHISADGRTIRSRPAAGLPAWRWQRLLTGQVLPLVAALRGLEVLHASAVAVGGLAFALAGDSGAGKSTLAAHLALRGYALLADDVVAVSVTGSGQPQAHRGSTALSVGRDDVGLASRLIRAGIATETGSDDKRHVLVSAADRSMPLGAVYQLGQDVPGGEPIGEPRSASMRDLMSCSYVKYVRTESRLTAQLSVEAAIARNCPIVPVNSRSGFAAEQLAAALEAHMAGIADGNGRL